MTQKTRAFVRLAMTNSRYIPRLCLR